MSSPGFPLRVTVRVIFSFFIQVEQGYDRAHNNEFMLQHVSPARISARVRDHLRGKITYNAVKL